MAAKLKNTTHCVPTVTHGVNTVKAAPCQSGHPYTIEPALYRSFLSTPSIFESLLMSIHPHITLTCIRMSMYLNELPLMMLNKSVRVNFLYSLNYDKIMVR